MMSQRDTEYTMITLKLNMSPQGMELALLTLSCSSGPHHRSYKYQLRLLNKCLGDISLMLSTLLHRNSLQGMVSILFTLLS